MAAQERVIGIDLGGTKIRAGIVDRDGTVEERREWPTPVESEGALLAGIDRAVEELFRPGVSALGLGVPSRIDQLSGRALGSVNIPLENVELRDRMRDRFELPVELENDGSAATLAEWALGVGRGTQTMTMLTLGTGVGGGFVLGGRLYRGWAEVGHMVVVHDGKPCQGTCTGRGHVESYCTGLAADEAAREAFGPDAHARLLVRLADEGDERALEILAGIGRILGSAIGTLTNLIDPQIVVIGGGFGVGAFHHLVGPALHVARREALAQDKERVRIERAALDDAGLIGAGLVAFEAL